MSNYKIKKSVIKKINIDIKKLCDAVLALRLVNQLT